MITVKLTLTLNAAAHLTQNLLNGILSRYSDRQHTT